MSFSKLPSDLTPEQLERIASSSQEVTISEPSDPVPLFLSTFDIRQGKNKVKSSVLHKLFCAWYAKNVTSRWFGNRALLYISSDKHSYYYLNVNSRFILDSIARLQRRRKRNPLTATYYKKSFEKYCQEFKIQPGIYWIEIYVLYYVYDKWSYHKRHRAKMSREAFTQVAKLYFNHREVAGEGTMLRVASPFSAVSNAELAELREGWKWSNAKKNKARKRKVSGAEAGTEPKD